MCSKTNFSIVIYSSTERVRGKPRPISDHLRPTMEQRDETRHRGGHLSIIFVLSHSLLNFKNISFFSTKSWAKLKSKSFSERLLAWPLIIGGPSKVPTWKEHCGGQGSGHLKGRSRLPATTGEMQDFWGQMRTILANARPSECLDWFQGTWMLETFQQGKNNFCAHTKKCQCICCKLTKSPESGCQKVIHCKK